MTRLSTRGFPRLGSAVTRAGLAGSALLALGLHPVTPWLSPEWLPLATTVAGTWGTMGLQRLWNLYRQRQAWQVSPAWTLAPEDLGPAAQGLLLGQAFPWTAHHTQFLETALARDGALPTATGSRGGHPVLHAVGQPAERPLWLPWSELVGHVLVTGTTRSGKTRTLALMARAAIAAPGAVVVLDPAGDRDLLARCAAEAKRRGKRFVLITPAFPAHSQTINVLTTATTPAEVSARIHALMPSGGGGGRDPFYEQYPLALVERIASAQQALGQPWTLEGLYRPAVLSHDLEQLVTDYLTHLGVYCPGKVDALIREYHKRGGGDLIADSLLDDLQKPRDHFTKVTANLIPTFRGVVSEPLGPLFSAVPGDVVWQDVAAEGAVVYVALASLVIGDTAHRLGRVILQDLVGYLGKRYTYEDMQTAPPFTILIDEAARVAYPLFTVALAMAGKTNARFILSQQSMADMESALHEKALAEQVYDNCNTEIFHRIKSEKTAQVKTEGWGTCTVHLPTQPGTSQHYGGTGGMSAGADLRFEAREVPAVRPAWLTALPRGEAFVRLKGELWKARMPLLTPVSAQELDELGLTALWEGLARHEETEEESRILSEKD